MVSCHRTNPVIDPAVRFMAAFPPGLIRARMVNLRATQAHSYFVRISKYSAGRIREAPTGALLTWFWGGLGVASEPGTRPDPRSGRRRFRLSCYRLVGRVPVLGPTGAAGLICPAWARGRGSRVRRPAGACHPSTMKGTAMTIVEDRPAITGGVDTHADMHVAAALDPVGGLLGVREFPATAAGYSSFLCWLAEFGDIAPVGVEGPSTDAARLA